MKVYFNKEKGTTVAVFDKTSFDGYNYIKKRTNGFDDFYPQYPFRAKKFKFPEKIIAKVRLRDGEEWDDAIATREVLHKADLIHKKHLNNYIKRWMIKVVRALDNVDRKIFNEVLLEEKGMHN